MLYRPSLIKLLKQAPEGSFLFGLFMRMVRPAFAAKLFKLQALL